MRIRKYKIRNEEHEVTGLGAGLAEETYKKKITVIENAVERYWT